MKQKTEKMKMQVILFKQSRILLYIALIFLIIFSLNTTYIYAKQTYYKNIILMIGDGMGISHIYAAQAYKQFLTNESLNIYKLSHMSNLLLVYTSSANSIVTDSSAGMTAIVTGQKTNNGFVSLSPDGKKLKTIFEYAKEKGKSTGIITTTRITHATPAACISHIDDRDNENEIALQMINWEVDVMMGGGLDFFLPKNMGGRRDDNINLLDIAKENNYTIVKNKHQLKNLPDNTKKVLGIFANGFLPFRVDNVPDVPTTSEMTKKALQILNKNKNGFFLMIEGGRIDHAAHTNDAVTTINEVIDYDHAIGEVLEFIKKNPNTLLIVSADHETGGFAIGGEGEMQYPRFNEFKNFTSSIEKASSKLKDLKPQEIKDKVKEIFGAELTEKDLKEILSNMENDTNFINAIAKAVSKYYGFLFASYDHTAEPIATFICCNVKIKKRGFVDNTDIFKIMHDNLFKKQLRKTKKK